MVEWYVYAGNLLRDALDCLEAHQALDEDACPENADAIEHVREALDSIDSLTMFRINRGVEGTSEV
jgi:hypothetical protein